MASVGTCDCCPETAVVRCKDCSMRFCEACRDDLACGVCNGPSCGACQTLTLDRHLNRVRSCSTCAKAYCSSCSRGAAAHRCKGCRRRWCGVCASDLEFGFGDLCERCHSRGRARFKQTEERMDQALDRR